MACRHCGPRGGLLGQIEGRTGTTVRDWINQRGEDWRSGVRFVAIDMCTIFKSAVRDALPRGGYRY